MKFVRNFLENMEVKSPEEEIVPEWFREGRHVVFIYDHYGSGPTGNVVIRNGAMGRIIESYKSSDQPRAKVHWFDNDDLNTAFKKTNWPIEWLAPYDLATEIYEKLRMEDP